jgi:hypothetical protein
MNLNSDWIELLQELNAADVRYMIVGAHAVILYTRPRGTIDFDVWVARDSENAGRVYEALLRFQAPLEELSKSDLESDDLIFQFGREPNRIDIITSIEGVEFEDAWPRRVSAQYGTEKAWFISKEDLLVNKRAVGRHKDLSDLGLLSTAETSDDT